MGEEILYDYGPKYSGSEHFLWFLLNYTSKLSRPSKASFWGYMSIDMF
jgi:hypothetical protein